MKTRLGWLLGTIGFVVSATTAWAEKPDKGLDVEACVRYALRNSAEIEEADAKVREWQARLAEVESTFYPKLFGTGFVAPMFTVEGNAFERTVTYRYESLRDWGPYFFLQATLAQPLYTFGRAEAGGRAALERRRVEEARVRQTRNTVAREVRKFYYLHLYARSMMPTLRQADEAVADAIVQAQALYDSGEGAITQIDLMKLKYGAAEVSRFKRIAENGIVLALAALKHTMAYPAERDIKLALKKLPRVSSEELEELAVWLQRAAEGRPEWDQTRHGQAAALALADFEKLATAPVLALAGQLNAAWTPTREDSVNPYHLDLFNDFTGGIALALQFDIDPWKASAREDGAMALHDQVKALKRFAQSGIPLQVKKAHTDVLQAREISSFANDAVKATRKWLAFAATAFKTGTGEAKDVLEGLAAYVQAKQTYYDNLQAYHLARAELLYAIGHAEWANAAN